MNKDIGPGYQPQQGVPVLLAIKGNASFIGVQI